MECNFCHSKLVQIIHKKPQIPSKYTCSGCGVKLLSPFGCYFSCVNIGCGTTRLCSSCKICPKGHFLQKVLFLNAKGENLYAKNKFYCDICHATISVPKEGILHCNECEWDICQKCLGETELNF